MEIRVWGRATWESIWAGSRGRVLGMCDLWVGSEGAGLGGWDWNRWLARGRSLEAGSRWGGSRVGLRGRCLWPPPRKVIFGFTQAQHTRGLWFALVLRQRVHPLGLDIALSEMEGDWKFEVPCQAVFGVGGGEVPNLPDPGRWGAASSETARGGTRGGGRLTLQRPLEGGTGDRV